MGAVEKHTLVKIASFLNFEKTPNAIRRPRWGTVRIPTKIMQKVPDPLLCLDF
jgi:hypothetical protein